MATMNQAPKSLVKKLAEIMCIVERVPKNGRNEFHRYDYATETDITAAVRQAMGERGVIMVPNVEGLEWGEIQGKNGVQKLCTMRLRFDIMDSDSGEVIPLNIVSQGMDSGDKAVYKALTGATKYALLKLFLIPTGDDPETEHDRDRDYEPRQSKPPAKAKPTTAAGTTAVEDAAIEAKMRAQKTEDGLNELVPLVQGRPEESKKQLRAVYAEVLNTIRAKASAA